jgi:hypothetical protein
MKMRSQLHIIAALPPRKIWIVGWIATTADLDVMGSRKMSASARN